MSLTVDLVHLPVFYGGAVYCDRVDATGDRHVAERHPSAFDHRAARYSLRAVGMAPGPSALPHDAEAVA